MSGDRLGHALIDGQRRWITVAIALYSVLGFDRIRCGIHEAQRSLALLFDDDGLHSGHGGLNLEGVLNADDLIDSVTKSSELLAPVVKLILVHTELHV